MQDIRSTTIRAGRRRRMGTDRGFTLVELLVCIAIITLLMSLLIPALNAAKSKAYQLKCQSQMRALGMAYNMYTQDYGGWLPRHSQFNPLNLTAGLPATLYLDYLGGESPTKSVHALKIYRCPLGPTSSTDPTVPAWAVDYNGSYAQNRWFFRGATQIFQSKLQDFGLKNPGSQAWLAELKNIPDGSYWDNPSAFTTRHDTGGNVMFLDSHVVWIPTARFNALQSKIIVGSDVGY